MKVISVLDTSVCEYNLGNCIIMDSVMTELEELFSDCFFYRIPYQIVKGKAKKVLKSSDLKFLGGTNSLSSYMNKYKQWDLSFHNMSALKNIVMMGLGWWQYQGDPNIYTKLLLKNTLNPEIMHSVRDSYTEKKLKSIGINAINTACPTMWRLDNTRLSSINSSKGKYAVITITDYNKNPQKDKALIDICINNYEEVYIWIQGVGDYRYIQDMGREGKVNVIEPNLKAFDEVLENKDVDYIGTRLHAGIRALQKNRRTFIIAIDNRALELGKDFGLKTIKRDDVGKLDELINEKYKLQLNIPYENIQLWKSQFRNAENLSFDGKKVYNL